MYHELETRHALFTLVPEARYLKNENEQVTASAVIGRREEGAFLGALRLIAAAFPRFSLTRKSNLRHPDYALY